MIVFAWALASYQFSWILYPLYLKLIKNQYGRRTSVKAMVIGATGLILFVLPFVVASPEGVYNGVFGSWKSTFQVETFNLSYWIITISTIQYIKHVQVALLLIFYLLTLKKVEEPRSFFKYSTWVSLLFILTGQLIWHYFLIMPAIHMLYYAREKQWS